MEFLSDSTVWLGFSFIIFGFVCYKFGKNAVLSALDERIDNIKKELETAETLRVEAQEMLAQYQRKHRDALNEAQKIIETAEQHASGIRQNAERGLTENLDRREKQLKERLNTMEQDALQEIREYATNLSIHATAQIIADQMDKKTSGSLIDQSIEDISKKLH